jgi:O-antigen/teichoic acid export membrane protein
MPHFIRRLFEHDLRNGVARDSAVVFAGQIARLALGLLSSAILARGLGPGGLSLFAVISSAIAIGLTAADFGLSNSAVRHIAADATAAPERALRTARAYARFKLIGGVIALALTLSFADPIGRALNLPDTSSRLLVWIAGLGMFASVLGGIGGTLLQTLRRFRALAASQTINAALTVVLLIVLVLFNQLAVPSALIVVAVVTTAVAAALNFAWLPPAYRASLTLRGPALDND